MWKPTKTRSLVSRSSSAAYFQFQFPHVPLDGGSVAIHEASSYFRSPSRSAPRIVTWRHAFFFVVQYERFTCYMREIQNKGKYSPREVRIEQLRPRTCVVERIAWRFTSWFISFSSAAPVSNHIRPQPLRQTDNGWRRSRWTSNQGAIRTDDVNSTMDLLATDVAEDESDELFSGNDRVSSNYGSNGIPFFFIFFLHARIFRWRTKEGD